MSDAERVNSRNRMLREQNCLGGGFGRRLLAEEPRHLIRNYPIASRSRMCLKPAVIIKNWGDCIGGKPKSAGNAGSAKGNIRLGCYIAEALTASHQTRARISSACGELREYVSLRGTAITTNRPRGLFGLLLQPHHLRRLRETARASAPPPGPPEPSDPNDSQSNILLLSENSSYFGSLNRLNQFGMFRSEKYSLAYSS